MSTKFVSALSRLQKTSLQKITASDFNELILFVYKPQDDKSQVILSVKKNSPGLFTTHTKPTPSAKPNSFVQIARKYLQQRRIFSTSANIEQSVAIIELFPVTDEHPSATEINSGPDCLILDLGTRPPRIIIAKKYTSVPERYQKEFQTAYSFGNLFFESWCEWTTDSTKTKRRGTFAAPIVGVCFLNSAEDAETGHSSVQARDDKTKTHDPGEKTSKVTSADSIQPEALTVASAVTLFPTLIRSRVRTRLQFLERRLTRQQADLPKPEQIEQLEKQSLGFKNNIHLWPKGTLTWDVPTPLVEEFFLEPRYTLKKGDVPGSFITRIHHEIDVLKRRIEELNKRIRESQRALHAFQELILNSAKELVTKHDTTSHYVYLCQQLDVSETNQKQHLQKKEAERRLPYRSHVSSTGEFIRVAKSAVDGDALVKLMPSNHVWLHVLLGEGSHVWLEKPKKGKKPSPQAIREAAILAVHHSKQGRAQSAEVQMATRADIEKKKNLAPGKVLVRRCETFLIRYERDELELILEGKK